MRYTDVYLWENRVGRLAWDSEKQYSSFVLDSSFLQTQLEFSPILIPLKGIDASQIYSYSENRQQTVENSSRDGNTRPPDLLPEKPVCRSGSNS